MPDCTLTQFGGNSHLVCLLALDSYILMVVSRLIESISHRFVGGNSYIECHHLVMEILARLSLEEKLGQRLHTTVQVSR